jgi:hypothetical protein
MTFPFASVASTDEVTFGSTRWEIVEVVKFEVVPVTFPDSVPPVSGRKATEEKAFEPRAVVVAVPPFAVESGNDKAACAPKLVNAAAALVALVPPFAIPTGKETVPEAVAEVHAVPFEVRTFPDVPGATTV